MLYLNKLLTVLKENPEIFKSQEVILILGLSPSQIKDLKKNAFENQLITQSKQGCVLTPDGLEFLENNPLQKWQTEDFTLRPEINLEYFKEEKIPAVLTKAIRAYAKYLLENQSLKENSLEHLISLDVKKCGKLYSKIEADILSGKRCKLEGIYEKYLSKGITKSLISVLILAILSSNKERVAIYEKSQFQLKFDSLMFDRIMACPQNFEVQKTEMPDTYILKDVSKIILNKKSDNILEITKGLYLIIKNLDKYTMNTQRLSNKTLRLRNVIVNAKDPISLFERDIPKVLSRKALNDCERDFLNDLKLSLDELKNNTENLVKELKNFILDSFSAKSKEELSQRFLAVKDYIGSKDLKVLMNNVVEIDVDENLWTNRIATFVNKFRVPKDWNDEDFADFKLKIKELALKFFVIESIVGESENLTTDKYHIALNEFLNLSKPEQNVFLKKVVSL